MTNTVTISCSIDTTDPTAQIGFEVWVNDQQFFNTDHVQVKQQISIEISDDDSEHELRFIMKNKTANDTAVDEAGNIITDARLVITDTAFDEIQLGHMLMEQAVYHHDFNGSGVQTQEKFYSEMGCNGTVSLKFTTPIYLWLLESM